MIHRKTDTMESLCLRGTEENAIGIGLMIGNQFIVVEEPKLKETPVGTKGNIKNRNQAQKPLYTIAGRSGSVTS